jgi:bilin biosynthesis protein
MSFLSPPNIQKLKEDRDVPGLIKALRYPLKSDVRQAAAEALGSLADPRAIEPLVVTLKDDREVVAEAAAQALVKHGEPAVDALIKLIMQKKFDGTGWNYRAQALKLACVVLGEIGDPRALSTLMVAAKDPDGTISMAADLALEQIQKK